LWTSNTGYLEPYLAKIGKPILSQGEVEIFGLHTRHHLRKIGP